MRKRMLSDPMVIAELNARPLGRTPCPLVRAKADDWYDPFNWVLHDTKRFQR